MTTDPRYPIYRYTAEWVQNGSHEQHGVDSWFTRGLPEGRTRDRASIRFMRKVRDDGAEIAKAAEWFTEFRAEKENGGEWSDVTVESEFLYEESWCLTWFSHYTFDDGRDDGDFLISFDSFVRRMQRKNDEARSKWDGVGYFSEPCCLMGAEDRYRWSAHADDDSRLPPPCRCEHCKAQGIVRIDH